MSAEQNIPTEQQRIRDKCYHPRSEFNPFGKEDIEQSVPERFEQMVRKYPHRLAVKDRNRAMTYDEI